MSFPFPLFETRTEATTFFTGGCSFGGEFLGRSAEVVGGAHLTTLQMRETLDGKPSPCPLPAYRERVKSGERRGFTESDQAVRGGSLERSFWPRASIWGRSLSAKAASIQGRLMARATSLGRMSAVPVMDWPRTEREKARCLSVQVCWTAPTWPANWVWASAIPGPTGDPKRAQHCLNFGAPPWKSFFVKPSRAWVSPATS